MDLTNVPAAVERVDREIGALQTPSTALRGAWAHLVRTLALEPARPMRDCPHCGMPGMRDATVCGYCWKALAPPSA